MKKAIKTEIERILKLVRNGGYDEGVNYSTLDTLSVPEALEQIIKAIKK